MGGILIEFLKKNAFVNVPNLLRNEMSLVIQYVDNV